MLDAEREEHPIAPETEETAGTVTLSGVLRRICRLTVEFVPCDHCAIYLWNDRREAIVPAAEHGTPAHLAAKFAERRHYPGRIAFERELRAGETVVISRDDPLTDEERRSLEEAELHALALVPFPRPRTGL